jgi:TonB family protein
MLKMDLNFLNFRLRNIALFKRSWSFHQSILLSLFIHLSFFFYLQEGLDLKKEKIQHAKNADDQTSVLSVKTRIYLVDDQRKLNFHNSLSKVSKKDVVKNAKKIQSDEINDRTTSQKDSGVNTKLSKYLSDVRNTIVKNKFKNKIASQLKLKGPVELGFVIEKPNIVKEVQVLKSSGHTPLDQSALQTLKNVENFPQIPEDLELSKVSINFTVEYL